jgi:hypothetical protein
VHLLAAVSGGWCARRAEDLSCGLAAGGEASLLRRRARQVVIGDVSPKLSEAANALRMKHPNGQVFETRLDVSDKVRDSQDDWELHVT